MINFDDYVNENVNEHNENWPHTPDHPNIILIIGVQDLEKQMYY